MNAFNNNTLILKGKLVEKTLESYEINEDWILSELHMRNINSIKDVQYAEIEIDGNLYIETRDSKQGTSCFIYFGNH